MGLPKVSEAVVSTLRITLERDLALEGQDFLDRLLSEIDNPSLEQLFIDVAEQVAYPEDLIFYNEETGEVTPAEDQDEGEIDEDVDVPYVPLAAAQFYILLGAAVAWQALNAQNSVDDLEDKEPAPQERCD